MHQVPSVDNRLITFDDGASMVQVFECCYWNLGIRLCMQTLSHPKLEISPCGNNSTWKFWKYKGFKRRYCERPDRSELQYSLICIHTPSILHRL